MGEALLVLIVAVLLAVPAVLTVLAFITDRAVDGVWVAGAMTAVFGAAMGVHVVGRQFSKKGDMLF